MATCDDCVLWSEPQPPPDERGAVANTPRRRRALLDVPNCIPKSIPDPIDIGGGKAAAFGVNGARFDR
jgi:hypothetical protein